MKSFIFMLLFGVFLFYTLLNGEHNTSVLMPESIMQERVEDNTTGNEILPRSVLLEQNLSSEDNLSQVESMIALAQSKIGSPYMYAKTGPDSFDCSGFVYYLFGEQDIRIARTSIAQSKEGTALSRTEIRKGDILFFDTSQKGHVNHSGIYLGEDKFIHASSGKAKGVTISDMDGWYQDKFLWGVRR